MAHGGRTRLRLVLEKAEGDLRQLIADELASGLYTEIPAIAHAAEVLSGLARNGFPAEPSSRVPPRSTDTPGNRSGAHLPAGIESRSSFGLDRTSMKYPRFYREGGRIVKASWSKSTDAEYEHKAGKAILDTIVAGLERVATKKKHFSVEELGRLRLDSSGPVIPAYQVYLCLAWLRIEGLLEQNGKDGYTIPKKDGFRKGVEERWAKLPEARASE